jgi:hypothetical protein
MANIRSTTKGASVAMYAPALNRKPYLREELVRVSDAEMGDIAKHINERLMEKFKTLTGQSVR